jgi:hypothetical protein
MSTGGKLQVFLEVGRVRTFTVVPDWPGWCRGGRDEASAMQALVDHGQRYLVVLKDTQLDFRPAASVSELEVIAQLSGNTTTDFGAPDAALPGDDQPVTGDELQRWETILQACWRTFDQAVLRAQGRELRTGPRGGGRTLEKIVAHSHKAEMAYLSSLGGKWKLPTDMDAEMENMHLRQELLATLAPSVRGEIPAIGPRGGKRWTPRFFVRRVAWHALDHAWEIEDRVI